MVAVVRAIAGRADVYSSRRDPATGTVLEDRLPRERAALAWPR